MELKEVASDQGTLQSEEHGRQAARGCFFFYAFETSNCRLA